MGRIIHLRQGMRLGERYKLVRPLGSGSMAEVWAAYDRMSSAEVAIKVISELMALSDQARRRFEREMQVVGSIHHPNVVSMRDHGQAADGRPFLVMELVEGNSFAEYLERSRRLGASGVLTLASQVLDGLDAAHQLGVVHRDLKPGNIHLTHLASGKRRVKVLDFGVAHTLEYAALGNQGRLTTTGSVLGSPRYMSCEVARGSSDIDQRADIFGMGATMYHAFAGQPPFDGKGLGEILSKVLEHDVVPLAQLRPDLPRRLVACVERAMAHRPKDRFVTAQEMRREVDLIAADLRSA